MAQAQYFKIMIKKLESLPKLDCTESIRQQIADLELEEKTLEARLQETQDKIESLQQEIYDIEDEIADTNEDELTDEFLDASEAEIKAIEREILRQERRLKSMENQKTRLVKKIEEAFEEEYRLRKDLFVNILRKQSEEYNLLVDQVINAGNKLNNSLGVSRLTGVHGLSEYDSFGERHRKLQKIKWNGQRFQAVSNA